MTTEPVAPPPQKTQDNDPPPPQMQTESTSDKNDKSPQLEPEAAAVLAYLRKRGLGTAALELEKHLDSDTTKKAKLATDTDTSANEENDNKSVGIDEKVLARKVAEAQEDKTFLNQSTGGRLGYDLDATNEIIFWAGRSKHGSKNNDTVSNKIRIQSGSKEDECKDDDSIQKKDDVKNDKSPQNNREEWEQNEATRLVRAFTKLQTWVLTLPNGEHGNHASIDTVLRHARGAGLETSPEQTNSQFQSTATQSALIPPSIKPELISVCFPLLINTYCRLLHSGLERVAHAFLSTYRHIHEPYHSEEFLDLDKCQSQQTIKQLQNLVNKCKETAKDIKKAKTELKNMEIQPNKTNKDSSSSSSAPQKELVSKLKSLEKNLIEYQVKTNSYPFLHRVLAEKWHMSLSSLTFQTLVRFFHSGDYGGLDLLPLSAMLQSQCYLVVENRAPVSYVPGYVLEDMLLTENDKTTKDVKDAPATKAIDIRWAAPTDMTSRLVEAGEDADISNSILKKSEELPFPSFYLKSEYATLENYKDDKKRVEFNRALLSNGFRRLEALEAKHEYESGVRSGDNSSSDRSSNKKLIGNPLEPSILFSTICASSTKSMHGHSHEKMGSSFPLNESSVDLTCAKLCLPDGRHVAAGCSDSAVRIWSMKSWNGYVGKSTVDSDDSSTPQESSVVLHGHKQGLPIYGIDWNRDGRTLLSAGGDGTIRLWDSKAVGPFGKLTSISKRSTKSTTLSKKASKTLYSEQGTHVPGAKPESLVEKHGTALACYQGHVKSSPIWSVAMAPSGYYFASAGSDSTARLWCTDRPTPVRILLGHYSRNINCVTWHPNCNYLLTGSDDKTVRMWDVQSGRSVRILSGCKSGINQIKVSPSGQYVAGTDYGGKLSIWDVRNGRKLKEYSCSDDSDSPIIHSMSYSPCGSTIATGGDDCSIRIWDARGLGNINSNFESSVGVGSNSKESFKIFRTSRSIVLDLEFTKRNLLLSVGKYSQ